MKYFTILLFCSVALQISFSQTITWNEVMPAGDAELNWTTACMSSDGSKIVAGTYHGRIYLSTDSGASWNEIQPKGNANGKWIASAMSADGNIIIVGLDNYDTPDERTYLSTDGGTSWTEKIPSGVSGQDWSVLTMSSTGSAILAGAYGKRLWRSTNGGTNWTETQPAGNSDKDWCTGAMSSDGNNIIIGEEGGGGGGRLYRSTDGGVSWSETGPTGGSINQWNASAISSTGARAIIGAYAYRLYINDNSTPLPVELTSFSAECRSQSVELKWTTATEVNNYGFEIERSAISSQSSAESRKPNAESWAQIAFVQGHGNSNSPKEYSFTENLALAHDLNRVQYRLKQIDLNGAFEYSPIVKVNVEAPSQLKLAQNYPNPFNPETTINFQIPFASHVTLKVYDVLGREVATLVDEFKQAGTYVKTLHATSLPSGVYFYKLQTANGFSETKKLMLMK